MKSKLLLLLLFLSSIVYSQSPGLINYQGLARNGAGAPLAGKTIAIRFELRQGAAAGPVVFTETQNGITTNSLGLFTTQIGKTNPAALSQLDLGSGSHYLSISVDADGSGSFAALGSQQLVSVPYALHAESVPASYTNNVLTIGRASYTLGQATSYTAGAGIAISGATITNSAPDRTVSLTAGNSNIAVSGTYPDFTVTSSPQLNISGNELSISNGNTVTVAPTLSISGNTLTIGPPGNTLTLPSPGTPTIQGSGIANVTPLTGTNFTVSVATPSFNSTGPASITGVYPNLTISSPATPSVSAAGIASVSAGPNYQVGVQPPVFSNVGPVTISGTYPNLTITSPTVPATSTITAAPGIATVSAGPNFTIGVQTPSFSSTGPSSITGTYPNLTLVSPATPTVSATGIASVSAGPNYQVGVPAPNFSSAGPVTISGTYPNLTVTSPTVPPSTSISAAGIATVSPGPNFTVGVRTPTFTSVGATTVSGTHPNYTVTTPFPPTPTVTGEGLAIVSPSTGINFTVNVPMLTYNATTAVLSSGSNTLLVAPAVSYSNNILNVGPATNSVDLSSSGAWKQAGTAVVLSNTNTTRVGIGTATPGINTGSARYLTLSATDTYQNAAAAFELQGASLSTTAPFAKLDFNSMGLTTSSNVARISAYRGGTTGEGMLGFSTSNGTLTERMFIDEFGKVGIGTRNPLENLQLETSGTTQLSIISGSTSGSYLSFGTAAGHFRGNILYDHNTNSMSFWTNNSPDRLFINNIGNVGIGTSAPGARFHTEVSNGRFRIYNFPPSANTLLLGEFTGNGAAAPQLRFSMTGGGPIVDIGQNPAGDFVVESNDNPKLVVQNSGNVGIGTTTPTERLELLGNAKITGSLAVIDGNQGDGKVFVSNSTGLGKWASSPAPMVFGGLNNAAVNVNTTPTALSAGTMTFTKVHTNSKVEIKLYSRAYSGTPILFLPFNWVKFEIYLDGNISSYSTEHIIFGQNVTEYINLESIFTNISAGSHTITIRANTDNNTATGVLLDPGGYGGKVIVQETF